MEENKKKWYEDISEAIEPKKGGSSAKWIGGVVQG